MTLKARLARLEHYAPQSGEHAAVMGLDARVHVYRCACGDPRCPQRPELRMVLHRRGNRAP
jgi:hypothetical protein